jgi:hypothetical protein
MKLSVVKQIVSGALMAKQDEICTHIKTIQNEGRRKGIEAAFARAFEAERPHANILRQRPPAAIDTESYYPGRKGVLLDCFLPDLCVALEYKAVRLPRQHSDNVSGALYDIGQLASDYLRLNRARKLKFGYVIAFVYGPLVLDAQSPSKLYRTFHNQMFVDFSVAKDNEDECLTKHRLEACKDLTWDSAHGESRSPEWVGAVKVGSLGAICIDCRD